MKKYSDLTHSGVLKLVKINNVDILRKVAITYLFTSLRQSWGYTYYKNFSLSNQVFVNYN